MPLSGQVALVTGAGRGIGQAIACAFATAGARVVVADIQVDSAQQTATSIGDSALAIELDVSSADSQDRVFERIASTYDRLDILVNNAGIFHVAPFLEFPLEAWRRVFSVNVDGALLATQRAALEVADTCLQIHGGAGDIKEQGIERAVRDARLGPIGGGTDVVAISRRPLLAEHAICVTVTSAPTSVREGMFGPIADEMASFEGLTRQSSRRSARRAAHSAPPESRGGQDRGLGRRRARMNLNGRLVYTEAHVGQVPRLGVAGGPVPREPAAIDEAVWRPTSRRSASPRSPPTSSPPPKPSAVSPLTRPRPAGRPRHHHRPGHRAQPALTHPDDGIANGELRRLRARSTPRATSARP
jgi:NAD(P)-dependent dehydrogenase (short-subunit alcohol dehydrogenase family)